ncbi:hypothetical protein ACJMK2_002136 [Sinanodonta woodiana]|uniref:Uncharacterized protein n=1 Tax=Sinanodonta woodiana TaxID=1069815 RepID=A0ABD3XXT7_SINWO
MIGLEQANAIDCYTCRLGNSSCNDSFQTPGAPTYECTGFCYKVKVKDLGCLETIAEDKCTDGTFGAVSGRVGFCKGNLCNYAISSG